jgi:hypothetical protein
MDAKWRMGEALAGAQRALSTANRGYQESIAILARLVDPVV